MTVCPVMEPVEATLHHQRKVERCGFIDIEATTNLSIYQDAVLTLSLQHHPCH